MDSKNRFLTAMRNGIPDRVPCAPDISNYIPCKHTGLPFWDIYFSEDISLWEAYMAASEYYGIDQWIASACDIPVDYSNREVVVKKCLSFDDSRDAMIARFSYTTPDGELDEEFICYRQEPPARTKRLIKDISQDWKRFRWLTTPPDSLDLKELKRIRAACDESGQAFGCSMGYPGFHMWEGYIEGGIQTLSFLDCDDDTALDAWFEADIACGTKRLELYLAEKPDYLLFGGSGTLTMSSPRLVERYAIPALRTWSKMAKDAGVATMLHSCGKSRLLVDMLVEHTDIDCINPLEMSPMGDVDLMEVKIAHGGKIALMGNLHTTDTMLFGTPDDVYAASKHAMEVAKEGGGFILSTGDQCPIDTPDENLFAMVQAVKDFGSYR